MTKVCYIFSPEVSKTPVQAMILKVTAMAGPAAPWSITQQSKAFETSMSYKRLSHSCP